MYFISSVLQKMRQNGVCRGIGVSHGVDVICQLYLLDLLVILDLNVLQSLWEITARRRDAVATMAWLLLSVALGDDFDV